MSRAERPGKGLASADLVRSIDTALQAGGALTALHAHAVIERRGRRAQGEHRAGRQVVGMSTTPVDRLAGDDHGIGLPADYGSGDEVSITAPPGRFFGGSTIPARVYSAVDDGRIVTTVPAGLVEDPFLRRSRRGLVIGAEDAADGPRFFGLDIRQARRRLAAAPGGSRLLISPAYAMDDLTLGLLWAVANFDEALLDDDAELAASGTHLDPYESLPRSAAGREIAGDLAPVSRMWLGSDFCARHILRHADVLDAVPTFWSREQRGEEASTWLFFHHKYVYLRRTVTMFSASGATASRSFCVPRSVVSDSSRPERILLMLALTLMESFGIRVDVCDEPEYAAMQGFVLDQARRAIVANWVGADGIWHVDVTDAGPLLREFVDATGYARSHSIVSSPTSAGRLCALADYLDLDMHWLARRCADLAGYGSAGIAQPRSRLLSVEGVDQACRFLARHHGVTQ